MLKVLTALDAKKMLKLKDTVTNIDILIKKYAGNSESQNLKSEYVRILGIVCNTFPTLFYFCQI